MGKVLKGTDAKVVPVYLDGMWEAFLPSPEEVFFKWPDKFRRRVTLYIGEPLPTDTPIELVRSKVHQLNARAQVEHRSEFGPLAGQVIRAWRRRGRRLQVADSTGIEVRGREALTRAFALRRMLRREVLNDDETNVGVLLPPSAVRSSSMSHSRLTGESRPTSTTPSQARSSNIASKRSVFGTFDQ